MINIKKRSRYFLILFIEGGAILFACGDVKRFLSDPFVLLFIFLWLTWKTDAFMMAVANEKEVREKKTIYFFAIFLILVLSLTVYDYTHFNEVLPRSNFLRFTGLILMFFGICIRFISLRVLGEFSTAELTIQKDHQLIKNGIYSYLRHPLYLGVILILLGIPIIFSSLYGLSCVIIIGLPILVYRIKIEEDALAEAFGNEYLEYIEKTKKLIPFVY